MNIPVNIQYRCEKDYNYHGKVISINVPNNPDPVLCVIQRADKSGIYFEPTSEWFKHNIFLGDKLECRIMELNEEHVFIGTVGNIDTKYPKGVQLLIDDIITYKNKRQYQRYYVSFTSNIFENTKGKIFSYVRNISLGGVHIVCKEKLNPKTLFDININIDKVNKLLFKARICWTTQNPDYYEYGLEITEIDEINRNVLEKIIYDLRLLESKFITNSLKK